MFNLTILFDYGNKKKGRVNYMTPPQVWITSTYVYLERHARPPSCYL